MNDFHKIVMPGRPIAKSNMYRVRVIGKRGLLYTTRELEEFELTLGKIVGETIPEVLTGNHALYVRVYQHGKRTIDIDNTFKAILDSFDHGKKIKRGEREIQVCATGIEDDKLFQLIIGERFECEDKEDERLEIFVAPYHGLLPFVSLVLKECPL
jgi:Holliday junction resolvase RusA-like endonuclease